MGYLKIPFVTFTRLAVSVVCLASCLLYLTCSPKKEATNETTGDGDLTGTWELREAQNGMMPTAQHAPGNGTFFRFAATTFEQYNNGALARRGSYEVVPDTTASETVGLELPVGEFDHRIIFDRDTTGKTFIGLRRDTLKMVTGFFPVDAGSKQVFVRTEKGRK